MTPWIVVSLVMTVVTMWAMYRIGVYVERERGEAALAVVRGHAVEGVVRAATDMRPIDQGRLARLQRIIEAARMDGPVDPSVVISAGLAALSGMNDEEILSLMRSAR